MRGIQRAFHATAMLALAVGLASRAGAQIVQAAPAETVPDRVAMAEPAAGEIVVTANKRAQNLNDVGLSVTALSGQALAERRITSVQDIAAAVPGLKFAESGTGTPIYTLRGIGFNEESLGVYPSVSVYTDEVALPFPVLTLRAAFDLERVEALKGPQGTLFGENATGGAINYIAAKPTDTLQYGADLTYGRFNYLNGNAFVSGPLGDKVAIRLAFSGAGSDGWQYSLTRPGDRNGATKYLSGRLTLDFDPTDTLKLRGTVTAWQDRSEPEAAQLIAVRAQNPAAVQPGLLASPFANLNPRSADWTRTATYTAFVDPFGAAAGTNFAVATFTTPDLAPQSDRKFVQGALRADLELGDFATLTSITSYLDFHQNLYSDKDGSAQAVANIGPSFAQISSFNQEVRLASAGKTRFRWLVGANYEDSKTNENQNLTFANGSSSAPGTIFINTTGSLVHQSIRNYAFFANGEYDLTSKLTATLGGRYTNSKNDANLCTTGNGDGTVSALFNLLPAVFGVAPGSFTPIKKGDCYPLNNQHVPGQRFIDTLAEDNFSWRAGLDYKPDRDTLFYATVSRGYKAGSFPTAAGSDFRSYQPVTQESVTSYEGGFKASLFDRFAQLNAAGFYYDYNNKQIRGKIVDPVFDVLDILINVPKSRVYGAEAELTVRPATGLSVAGSVTYLNSRVLTQNGTHFVGPTAYGNSCTTAGGAPGPCDFTGSELPFTPKWSYGLDADYRHDIGTGAILSGVDIHGQSSSVSTLNGRTIQFRTLPSDRHAAFVTQPFILPDYITVDARIGYEFNHRYKIMLFGKNIFNEYYVTNANHYLDTTVRFTGQPATYGVTLSIKS